MKPAERNEALIKTLVRQFRAAKRGQFKALAKVADANLDTVFSSTTLGYREILLVIVHARQLNPKYKASVSLYDCNPRSLYEGPIRSVLKDLNIPHRKSGPLNIAKAARAINDEWAAQRRPAEVARIIVALVKEIEKMSPKKLQNFAVALHKRFLDSAERIAALKIKLPPQSKITYLSELCAQLITNVPDGGNTPQRIVGLLLHTYHTDLGAEAAVGGHEDRASTTSTTSKKPGDIAEYRADGNLSRCYEVTVKAFGQQRMEECSDSLNDYCKSTGQSVSEVVVLCRPEDVHPEVVAAETVPYLGNMEHAGIAYLFLDIYGWLRSQLCMMSPEARLLFFKKLQEYVDQPNTAEKVKEFWRDLHAVKATEPAKANS